MSPTLSTASASLRNDFNEVHSFPMVPTGAYLYDPSSSRALPKNPEFTPIDQPIRNRPSSSSVGPSFERPRPAPLPPFDNRGPSTFYPTNPILATPPADDNADMYDEPDEFIAFLSKTGFIAADRRSSGIRRSGGISSTRSGRSAFTPSNSRPTSGISTSAQSFDYPGYLDSRRSSLAPRRISSGVLPPLLQDDTYSVPQRLESSPTIREEQVSKFLSHMRVNSQCSIQSSSDRSSSADEEFEFFHAYKISTVDFSDIEVLLGRTRSPILTQLHRAYVAQFELMASQITELKSEISHLISQRAADLHPPDRPHFVPVSRRPATPHIRRRPQSQSNLSPQHRSGSVEGESDAPFWQAMLEVEDADWDYGDVRARRLSNRCVSPRTLV